ncbi:hypothetical protein VPH35_123271 [Triticum aestivum]
MPTSPLPLVSLHRSSAEEDKRREHPRPRPPDHQSTITGVQDLVSTTRTARSSSSPPGGPPRSTTARWSTSPLPGLFRSTPASMPRFESIWPRSTPPLRIPATPVHRRRAKFPAAMGAGLVISPAVSNFLRN